MNLGLALKETTRDSFIHAHCKRLRSAREASNGTNDHRLIDLQ